MAAAPILPRTVEGSAPRLWVPRQVLVTPDALRWEHGRRVVERSARLGSEVVELKNNRLTGLRGGTERDEYVRAKRTLAVVVASESARKLQSIPPSATGDFTLPRALSVLLCGGIAQRSASHSRLRQSTRDPGWFAEIPGHWSSDFEVGPSAGRGHYVRGLLLYRSSCHRTFDRITFRMHPLLRRVDGAVAVDNQVQRCRPSSDDSTCTENARPFLP